MMKIKRDSRGPVNRRETYSIGMTGGVGSLLLPMTPAGIERRRAGRYHGAAPYPYFTQRANSWMSVVSVVISTGRAPNLDAEKIRRRSSGVRWMRTHSPM
jgi:hypothetical protein